MAHLATCWCGRTYRCELDHRSPPGVLRCFEDERHFRCPDYILHGPLRIEFTTVSSPIILGPGAWPKMDFGSPDILKE